MLESNLPPQSREAERGLLGSVLRDNEMFETVSGVVSSASFYFDAHQKVWAVFEELRPAGRPVDLVILFEALKARGQVDDVGGIPFLTELWEAVPTAANAEYYAQIVRDRAVARGIIHVATEAIRDAQDGVADPMDLASAAAGRMTDLAAGTGVCEGVDLALAATEAADELALICSGAMPPCRVRTGWRAVDDVFHGMEPGTLTVVGGRPGEGKSLFLLGAAMHVAFGPDPQPVYFVSLEMRARELAQRAACSVSGVSLGRLKKGTADPTELARMATEVAAIRPGGLRIVDDPGVAAERLAALARRFGRKAGGLGLVVVDYLQIMSTAGRFKDKRERLDEVSRCLKLTAKSLGVPVLAAAQLSRKSKEDVGGEPQLHHLRDSGAIEQDADNVLLVWKLPVPDGHDPTLGEPVGVKVAKQRQGGTGFSQMLLEGRFCRFVDLPPPTFPV